MSEPNDPQRSYVARWALALFIFGLLAPLVLILLVGAFTGTKPPMRAAADAAPFAAALGAIAEVLALVLGIVGRRHVAGRIAWIGATALLAMLVGAVLIRGGIACVSSWGPTKHPEEPAPPARPAKPDRPRGADLEDYMRGQQEVYRMLGTTSAPATSAPDGASLLPLFRGTKGLVPSPEGPTTLPAGAAEAPKRQAEAARALGISKELTLDLGKGATMKLVLIPAGKFMMGSTPAEQMEVGPRMEQIGAIVKGISWRRALAQEAPRREVTISKPFYMGIYEVTQAQYKAVMGTNPTDGQYDGNDLNDNNPVGGVGRAEALEFCAKLSAGTGRTIRLPTEAEWEYACRAGTSTRFFFGDDEAELHKYGNYHEKSSKAGSRWQDNDHDDGWGRMAPVGSYKPNAWGLYDMHGNVWEWVSDRFLDTYEGAADVDPQGPTREQCDQRRRSAASAPGSFTHPMLGCHVTRGGSSADCPPNCRSAHRVGALASWSWPSFGFRVVAEAATE